jgi:predicted AlkP superfamily phosphohydrolase/phosphomutase
VVRNVWKREKIYTGDWSLLAPDLQILWNEEVQLNPQDARIQVAPWKIRGSGDHRLMGTIIACGPPFRSGTEIHGAQVYDIAPTILYRLQQAIPVHLDGRPLIEAFEDTFVHFHPIRVTKSSADAPQDPSGYDLSETDVETIEQRLRGLGYL